ncbi:hypothetical protein [Thermomonospora curvata]|uniref:Uncharacterized protein n=1 Tax=Thermomonospora curvata (strain ATCC 19995 / DSM 43183 / JCM 3096 / KCTC 9072 / NBRC 15933 / NCIMB 10081 / Henssen B9) TaxID=471852 RepID=D1A876_THECD|nr:hypothetical protein [Thermomonospora curvata]ACZ00391.1 hypothetical protein Tcur_4873 [Thermomonospora curvata DSM 43183]
MDVAPFGQACEAIVHADSPVPAVVRAQNGSWWCALHWWPIALAVLQGGYRIVYSQAAWARLGPGGG